MQAVHDVVAAWLDYPLGGTSYWRAVYVEVLYKSMGADPLVLDCVWNVYRMVSKCMMGSRKKTSLIFDVDTSPYLLFDKDSQLRRDLSLMSTIVFAFAAGQHDIPNDDVLKGATPIEHVNSVVNDRLEAFKKFVNDCFGYCFYGKPTHTVGLEKLLHEEGDRYLPFREHAPTRENLRRAGGPFSPAHVRTVEGLYSAIVNRAITFNTKFSREGRTLFTSPEDFYRAVEELGCEKETDYCNRAAYRQTNSRKHVELVMNYWGAVLEEPRWPAFEQTTPISFEKCFNYFYPSSGTSKFPQLGKLGAYLLTADYVYAGVVKSPSLETVSKMIKKINKGPVSALEILGLAPQRSKSQHGDKHCTPVQSLSSVVETVHQAVEESIPSDSHTMVGVDYIMTEHAMCKFARVVGGKKPLLRIDK